MTTTFKEVVKVALRPDEVEARSDEMAQLVGERDEVEAEKKAASAEFSKRLDEKDTRISLLAKQVRDKAEERELEIYRRHDRGTLTCHTYRADTNELIDSRPFTPDEVASARQEELPLDGEPTKKRRSKKGAEPDGVEV